MNAERQIVPGIFLSASGQATVDPALADVLFDLAIQLEEPTNLAVDVEHVLAAIVLAADNGELAPDTPLSSDIPGLANLLTVYVKTVFAEYWGGRSAKRTETETIIVEHSPMLAMRLFCSKSILSSALLVCLVMTALSRSAPAQEKDFNAYPDDVARYLTRIYGETQQPLAYRQDFPGGVPAWQKASRRALREKLGLQRIAASARNHQPSVKLGEPEDLGQYTRQKGVIETEPDVRLPFWLLKPKGAGPWPLGVFPHGHDRRGHNTTAGVYSDEAHKRKSLAEDRDVAVQAVRRGFVAIAPAVRGLSTDGVPDLHGRHGKRECRSQAMHCLLAGRTAMGERVWDMQRILDWASKLDDVDAQHVLIMGNSGGGMVTLFSAACDERITIAVPSCSFAPTTSKTGYIFHCDCNMVPGLIELGGLSGVAGLIAPRRLLTVNGRQDALFTEGAIERAAAETDAIYRAAGHAQRFEQRWGEAGHRFYADLMWPFVVEALKEE